MILWTYCVGGEYSQDKRQSFHSEQNAAQQIKISQLIQGGLVHIYTITTCLKNCVGVEKPLWHLLESNF